MTAARRLLVLLAAALSAAGHERPAQEDAPGKVYVRVAQSRLRQDPSHIASNTATVHFTEPLNGLAATGCWLRVATIPGAVAWRHDERDGWQPQTVAAACTGWIPRISVATDPPGVPRQGSHLHAEALSGAGPPSGPAAAPRPMTPLP